MAHAKNATGRRRRRLLPLVALARGVLEEDGGQTWAQAWAEVRAQVCGERSRACVMTRTYPPRPSRRPADAADVTQVLRETLVEVGAASLEQVAPITSHSCKATVLSWACKLGVRMPHRRVIGGHTKPGEKSPRAYGREELAAPLRALARLYGEIRSGVFLPDQTRSGMIVEAPPPSPAAAAPTGGGDHDASSSDGEDDDDGENDTSDDGFEEPAAMDTLLAAEFVVSRTSLVRHVVARVGARVACGRPLGDQFRVCVSDLPICRACTSAVAREAAQEAASAAVVLSAPDITEHEPPPARGCGDGAGEAADIDVDAMQVEQYALMNELFPEDAGDGNAAKAGSHGEQDNGDNEHGDDEVFCNPFAPPMKRRRPPASVPTRLRGEVVLGPAPPGTSSKSSAPPPPCRT